MNEKRIYLVHWTSAKDNGLIVLFDDNTWKRYDVPYYKDYCSTKAHETFSNFMNMRHCTQQKMTESQVDEYVQNRIQEFMEYEWGLK